MNASKPIVGAMTESAWQTPTLASRTGLEQTMIHPNVIATIVALAVRETNGVARLATASGMDDLRVRIATRTNEASVDIRIVCDHDAVIPSVADTVRRNVAHRLATMTGIHVVEVNIDVIDINFDNDETLNR